MTTNFAFYIKILFYRSAPYNSGPNIGALFTDGYLMLKSNGKNGISHLKKNI